MYLCIFEPNPDETFQIEAAHQLLISGKYQSSWKIPNDLSLTNDATTVDLSGYLDNTDAQELALSGSTLSISGGTNTIDLSSFAGTDAQDLSLSGNTLSLTNDASTVDLSAYVNTDSQNLTSATLSGNTLTIQIENGTSVDVDLSPILSALQTENANQQTQIDNILNRLDIIEACACGGVLAGPVFNNGGKSGPILYQNIPNPFNNTSIIKYYLPSSIENATIVFSDMTGKIIHSIDLNETGEKELNISTRGLASGMYNYTMFISGKMFDSKKMIIKD